jgi:hypothetical protein
MAEVLDCGVDEWLNLGGLRDVGLDRDGLAAAAAIRCTTTSASSRLRE